MKRILFFLILLCIENALHAQYVYTIRADSVKITNTCDTAELIINPIDEKMAILPFPNALILLPLNFLPYLNNAR